MYSNVPGSVADREAVAVVQANEAIRLCEKKHLQDVDLFILDNSIRESTVGQIRGHTIENKKKILAEIKRCGIKNMVVGTFADYPRVDDDFVQWLKEQGEDFSQLWAFSEVSAGTDAYDAETIPVALLKNKKFGIYNIILEMDLNCNRPGVEFVLNRMCQLLMARISWIRENINAKSRILLNFRDFPAVMQKDPQRALSVLEFLAMLPKEKRIFGVIYEDGVGDALPQELAAWTASFRRVMDAHQWDARLLVHVHQKWELPTAGVLQSIQAGADGVWASLCNEGAALGHASSTVTLLNLIRLGNQKVLKTYNCKEFRKAAIRVSEITTNRKPPPKQAIYGERALDLVFDSGGMAGASGFNLHEFFGEKEQKRITTLASPAMIRERLINLFGANEQFTIKMAEAMKTTMLNDLRSVPPRKEEYMSEYGIIMLFNRAGGTLSAEMCDIVAKVNLMDSHHKAILADIRDMWDEAAIRDGSPDKDSMSFDAFYCVFLSPFFDCFESSTAVNAMRILDMNEDGLANWDEFSLFVKWALYQYPNIAEADEAIQEAIEKGLIPAMAADAIIDGQHK